MIKLVKSKVLVSSKGQDVDFIIPLPNNSKRIVGLQIGNSVDASTFAPAPPYVPPTPTLSASVEGVSEVVEFYFATANGAGYTKYDRIKKSTIRIFDGFSQYTTITYTNIRTNATITPTATHLAQVEEDEFYYNVGVKTVYFEVTNTREDYPFGLTVGSGANNIPAAYRYVQLVAEADATTLAADLGKIVRFGTTDITTAIGTPLGNQGQAEFSKPEFEALSIIGLQAAKNHTIQLYFIN